MALFLLCVFLLLHTHGILITTYLDGFLILFFRLCIYLATPHPVRGLVCWFFLR